MSLTFSRHDSHCLVSTPLLNKDPLFHRSVVLLVEKSQGQYFGVLLNKASPLTLTKLNQQNDLDLPQDACEQNDIRLGGPIANHQIFVLHHISCSYILEPCDLSEIGQYLKLAPNVRFFLGISAWEQGQIEKEIFYGYWHTLLTNSDLIFHSTQESCYQEALRLLHIHDGQYVEGSPAHA